MISHCFTQEKITAQKWRNTAQKWRNTAQKWRKSLSKRTTIKKKETLVAMSLTGRARFIETTPHHLYFKGVFLSPTSDPPENLPCLMPLGNALDELRAAAAAAHEARRTGQARGPITGISKLDRELSGAFVPGLHVIHGAPGTGKTAFTLQVAAECKCPALFVTCEMSPAELLRRHTARITGTFLGRLKSGEMSSEEVERLALRAIEAAPELVFIDATRAAAPPYFLRQCAESEAVHRGSSKFLIVIDSLHTWTQAIAAKTGAPEYEALNDSIRQLQQLAAHLQCPILMISERNREGMKDGGQSAGAGTRKIEYQAETVISLEKGKDGQENGAGEIDVIVKFLKNRHGSIGRPIPLKFNGAKQEFTEE